jgi:glycosyltransferase involved in cell wall biosynthesis
MKLLVDGVLYQVANGGITRIWSAILPRLAKFPDLHITFLDRGNAPFFPGVERIEFPSYKMNNATAADSILVDEFCRQHQIDVFSSTYYTTPLMTPSVLVVYDMIPELLGFDLEQRPWQEKQIAISYADSYACISESARQDLERFYPGAAKRAVVAHCGVESDIFRTRQRQEIEAFKAAHNISKPYFLLTGSREQHLGNKSGNGILIFKAARSIRNFTFELICIGGGQQISDEAKALLSTNASARWLELSDAELAVAYSGAEALLLPSLYEGFGVPVLEAMACGCPVITTPHDFFREIADNAALFIRGDDPQEQARAMNAVRENQIRSRLVAAGCERAAHFSWDAMAHKFYELLKKSGDRNRDSSRQEFYREWARLRAIQAAVDPS